MPPSHALARLRNRLEAVGAILAWPEERLYLRIEGVSGWSPAQHLDHVFKSLEAMLECVEVLGRDEDPAILRAGRPTWPGRVVLLTGWIPRGRGEAPSPTRPDPRPVRHRLHEAWLEASRRVERVLATLPAGPDPAGRLPHPVLGAFDLASWARFADVHTHHHLRIVARIDRHRAIGVPDEARGAAEEKDLGIGAEPS